MKFTDERCIPGKSGNVAEAEHSARYEFARKYVKDRKVLDVGCGVGYGSALLASIAKEVIGIDISNEAIDYAKQNYLRENVRFHVGDATDLDFLKDEQFDVIASFEVIEHVPNYFQYLSEVQRLLKDDGIFIISTPNKKYHSPSSEKPLNPFHVTEFWLDDFKELLKKNFGNVKLYGQYYNTRIKRIVKKLLPKKVWEMSLQKIRDNYQTRQVSNFSDKNVENYSYLIAICRK